jgi:branched-chain amino acid transport system substrate-binding protein
VTLPATEISERYEVPFIAANAIAGSITSRGLKYVFKPRISVQSEAQATVDFAVEKGAKKVAIMTANITIGEEARNAWLESIEESNLELVNEISYPSGSPDFSDAILSIKSSKPDVLFALGNTSDAILLVRQMKELGYWPEMGLVTAGGGFSDSSLISNLGEDAEGIYVTTDWSPTVPLPGGAEINDRFKAKYGLDMGGGTNTSYASIHLLAAAVEAACSRDPKAIAETLRTTSFDEGVWNFMFPQGISFDETGYIKNALVLIAQIQEGKQVVVWPDELSVGTGSWPVPGWNNR